MAGEYRLGRLLGEGGFGAVYEAEHPLLKRRAAVKVLHRVADRDSDAVQRFISEAQAVNQIRSRHIIDVFSFGTLGDGRHFYVMDFLDGEPLDRFLERVGRLDVPTALQLLQPIAEALDLAHGAGIIHRDLKPQNIFLAWDKNDEVIPKLLDFGMAKLLSNSPVRTVSGTPIGTPLYMSPEQARGGRVDSRCDVYSLGVLCYEMLVGRVPFDGETTVAILMAHVIQAPEQPSQVSDLSPEFDLPLLRMLEKDPDLRPSSAGEALQGLRAAAEKAGLFIPPGLPRLPRPEPAGPSDSEEEVASTLLADPPTPEKATEVSVVQATTVRPTHRRTWLWIAALLTVSSALTFWFTPNPTAPERAGRAPAARGKVQQVPLRASSASVVPMTVPGGRTEEPSQAPATATAQPTAERDKSAEHQLGIASAAVPSSKRPKTNAEIKPKKNGDKGAEALTRPTMTMPAASTTPRDLESPFGP